MVNRCWSFSTSFCCWNFCNWYCESSKYNNLYTLAANHRFCHEWSYFESIMKEMVAFFLSKGIVKGGELIIYLFVYLFFAVTYFLLVCWCFCCDCCCCCLFVCFLCLIIGFPLQLIREVFSRLHLSSSSTHICLTLRRLLTFCLTLTN